VEEDMGDRDTVGVGVDAVGADVVGEDAVGMTLP
jgi:hypothetical protein